MLSFSPDISFNPVLAVKSVGVSRIRYLVSEAHTTFSVKYGFEVLDCTPWSHKQGQT
jgi:hypothetical protein